MGAGTGFEQPHAFPRGHPLISARPHLLDPCIGSSRDGRQTMRSQDRPAEEAFTRIAALLAAAYQRYAAVRRVPQASPEESPYLLDKSGPSSPHEQ